MALPPEEIREQLRDELRRRGWNGWHYACIVITATLVVGAIIEVTGPPRSPLSIFLEWLHG